mgnify:CR=1 FL=1
MYTRLAAEQCGNRVEQLVDIGVANLLRVDWLRALFPNAKLVLVVRHPADLVLGALAQSFQPSALTHHLLSVAEIVRLLQHAEPLTHRVMKVFGERAHVLRYEAFVADPKTAVTALLQFAGLPPAREVRRQTVFGEGLAPDRWMHYWPWLKRYEASLAELAAASGYPLIPPGTNS